MNTVTNRTNQNGIHLNFLQQVFEEYNQPDNYGLEHIMTDIVIEKPGFVATAQNVDWFGLSDLTI
jgi:hypothetical protein